MFLLLGGTGVGYSVQNDHVEKLPSITVPTKKRRYLVGDSIEGWADCIKMLMKAYFLGKPKPDFDFSGVRPKGALLNKWCQTGQNHLEIVFTTLPEFLIETKR